MTTQEFIQRVAKIKQYVLNDFTQDILVRGAVNLQSRIENRVRETGRLSDGSTRNYSTKPILVGPSSFKNETSWTKVVAMAKSNKEKNAGIHWITFSKEGKKYRLIVLPGGYKKVRELDGLPSDKKNYSRTTDMWTGFDIKGVDKMKVILGGTTDDSQDRINWNSRRDKIDIIAPTEQEEKELYDFVAKGLKDYAYATLSGR